VLYDSPVNAFVAGFIGSPAMNLIEGTDRPDGCDDRPDGDTDPGARASSLAAGDRQGSVTVGLRPEATRLVGDGHGIPAVVNLVEELGAEAYVYSQLPAWILFS
jgi:multiple sugar transport system ATP-binding protein